MTETPTFQHFKTSYASLKGIVPEVSEEELSFLVMTGFYDGPLEGVVEYNGKKCWYEVVSDFVSERTRYFALIELSEEEYQNELYWQRQFEGYVADGFTDAQKADWEKTYDVHQKQRESANTNKEVVAWFQMS